MAKATANKLSEEAANVQSRPGIADIPTTDNEPGAPEALLKVNRLLRGTQWPTPYDRTRHEMILGVGDVLP